MLVLYATERDVCDSAPVPYFICIGVDLARLLGGRMALRRWICAEWDGVWGGMSLSSRLRGLEERRELPQRGPRQSLGRKRILEYFEGHKTLILVRIWQNLGGAICISVPRSKFFFWGGTCLPCSPVIYAHVRMHGRPLYFAAVNLSVRTPFSGATARNSTKLCHVFGNEPDLRSDIQMWDPQKTIFGWFYNDIAT